MNKWTPLAAVLVLVVFLAMFSLSTPGFSAPDGKAVMEARCGDCHACRKKKHFAPNLTFLTLTE